MALFIKLIITCKNTKMLKNVTSVALLYVLQGGMPYSVSLTSTDVNAANKELE